MTIRIRDLGVPGTPSDDADAAQGRPDFSRTTPKRSIERISIRSTEEPGKVIFRACNVRGAGSFNMRIVRFAINEGNDVHWGSLEDERVFVTSSPGGEKTGGSAPLASVRLLAPALPTKIVCVGRKLPRPYQGDGQRRPYPYLKSRVSSMKGPNSRAAPFSEIPYPHFTNDFHYEGELALVIGKRILPGTEHPSIMFWATQPGSISLPGTARDVTSSGSEENRPMHSAHWVHG